MSHKEKAIIAILGIVMIILIIALLALCGVDVSSIHMRRGFHIGF